MGVVKLRGVTDPTIKEPAIVPLVNIVFLLLIFFMLLGRIASPEALQVQPPISASSGLADSNNSIVILISANGRLAIGENEIEQDLLVSTVSKLIDEDPAMTIKIKADAGLDAVVLIRMMEQLKDVGVKRILLLTERTRS